MKRLFSLALVVILIFSAAFAQTPLPALDFLTDTISEVEEYHSETMRVFTGSNSEKGAAVYQKTLEAFEDKGFERTNSRADASGNQSVSEDFFASPYDEEIEYVFSDGVSHVRCFMICEGNNYMIGVECVPGFTFEQPLDIAAILNTSQYLKKQEPASVTEEAYEREAEAAGYELPPEEAAAPELVSAAVESEYDVYTEDSVIIQDMYSFMQNRMGFEPIDKDSENAHYRRFTGGKDSYELVDAYVETLCSGAYNLELVDSYYESFSSGDIFFSYAMDYTGSGRVSGNKLEMSFEDDVYGDVTIWGSKTSSSYKGYITIRSGLEYGDLGLRIDGSREDNSLPGVSLNSDLYRMPDGSYQTGDGRFNVRIGEAAVYRDGELCTTDASLTRNIEKSREELRIFNFYRNDSILLTVPYNSVLTGDILEHRSIGINQDGGYEEYIDTMEDLLDWKFSNKMLGVCHDGDYLFCYCDDYNDFDEAVVRVMYWDPGQNAAVFYIYASFDTAPYEYEALAAVSLDGVAQEQAESSSGSYTSNVQSTLSNKTTRSSNCFKCHGSGEVPCTNCNGRGYKENYVSTPNYSGSTSFRSSTTVRENCFKCHGSGKISCSRCNGSGKTTY